MVTVVTVLTVTVAVTVLTVTVAIQAVFTEVLTVVTVATVTVTEDITDLFMDRVLDMHPTYQESLASSLRLSDFDDVLLSRYLFF